MLFTPNDVFTYARDRAARKRDSPLEPTMQARAFNDVLRGLIGAVNDVDPERLADEHIVTNADVTADDDEIDLTESSTRDWLKLEYMDWRSSATGDYLSSVVLSTIEARHRAGEEYGHLGNPIGYLFAKMTKVKKLHGWDGVYDLRVYGTILPNPIDPRDATDDFTVVLDYPEPLYRALQTGYLLRVAPHLSPSQLELTLWMGEHRDAMGSLGIDTRFHVGDGLRVEDVPHLSFDLG